MRNGKGIAFARNLLPFMILILGVAVLAYPSFSDWWNTSRQSRAIASYVTVVSEKNEEEIAALFDEARSYNDYLMTKPNVFAMSEDDVRRYESLLNVSGRGIMGYVQIDSIGVNLPIYHGTADSVLQTAIGHIEWSSLPVGGPGTHAVVSGHRGLPSAKLFSELDKMKIGDVFTITVLDETLTYMVDKITIVVPEDTSELMIKEGLDLCTLVTCTPYGINTHRLLVRGHRIENIIAQDTITNGATRVSNTLVFFSVFIPILFLLLLGLLITDLVDFGVVPESSG